MTQLSSNTTGVDDNVGSMLVTDLKKLAGSMGIKGASVMRKQELVAAIRSARSGAATSPEQPKKAKRVAARSSHKEPSAEGSTRNEPTLPVEQDASEQGAIESVKHDSTDLVGEKLAELSNEAAIRERVKSRASRAERTGQPLRSEADSSGKTIGQPSTATTSTGQDVAGNRAKQNSSSRNLNQRTDRDQRDDGRRNRRRRSRGDRSQRQSNRYDTEPEIREDDIIEEVAGIIDVLDNYAFLRTSGYLPGQSDAYVSMSLVRRYGLRKGDALTGAIRLPKEGERKEKFSPLVRVDKVNGRDPELMKNRPEFAKLTPLYPSQRLRMETGQLEMSGRIIDMVSPIGKGQRGLIVSPPKAGKTMIMQAIANAITSNNPEVHLMVILVDERPEEVTDFQRTTQAEVIASTFDRPADDHTAISELAIERAKRLVELGQDVVILLDGITRLGRAYNLAAPASGRILSGGVDSAALYPPKKFFGAARNIENGGSLTILATALVETGSKMDEVIFEEFKGTGNMELRLRRDLADKRVFPAIDVDASGTRREELLINRDELAIIWKLRRVLSGLESQQALETLLKQMKKTRNNGEFLVQISRTTPNPE